MPSLDLERDLHRLGRTLVAGVDEVGRGALAGPVMAGAVILPPDLDPSAPWLQGIDDSKKLTPLQRERAAKEIHQHALAVSVGEASPEEIDRLGIVAATRLAMVRAVSGLSPQPQHLLVDYLSLEECGLPVTPVTHGDSLSHSIASAAIAAKVARDRLMVDVRRSMAGLRLPQAQRLRYADAPPAAQPAWAFAYSPLHLCPRQEGPSSSSKAARVPSPRSRLGGLGERLAQRHLRGRGCRILDTNYRCRWGEVDIVAQFQDTILFVEVKTRRTSSYGTPEEAITSAKAQRLIATAETYLDEHNSSHSHWRIDLISVEMDRTGRVLPLRHLEERRRASPLLNRREPGCAKIPPTPERATPRLMPDYNQPSLICLTATTHQE